MPLTAHGQQMIDAAIVKTLARTIDVACGQCGEIVHVDFQDTLRSGDALSCTLTHRLRDEHDIQIFVNGVEMSLPMTPALKD